MSVPSSTFTAMTPRTRPGPARRVLDYVYIADLLDHYSPVALIGFARRLDPSLGHEDFASLARRLDGLPQMAFDSHLGRQRPEEVTHLAWTSSLPGPATPGRSAPAALSASAPPLAGISSAGHGENAPNQDSPPGGHATCPKSSRVAADPSDPNRTAIPGFPNDPMWTASSHGAAGNAKQTVTARKSDDDHRHPAEREQASITDSVLRLVRPSVPLLDRAGRNTDSYGFGRDTYKEAG